MGEKGGQRRQNWTALNRLGEHLYLTQLRVSCKQTRHEGMTTCHRTEKVEDDDDVLGSSQRCVQCSFEEEESSHGVSSI